MASHVLFENAYQLVACAGKDGSSSKRRKGRRQHTESFMIASANESTPAVAGVPAWRIALGNIAAGATAGATVEAGEATLSTLLPKACDKFAGVCK